MPAAADASNILATSLGWLRATHRGLWHLRRRLERDAQPAVPCTALLGRCAGEERPIRAPHRRPRRRRRVSAGDTLCRSHSRRRDGRRNRPRQRWRCWRSRNHPRRLRQHTRRGTLGWHHDGACGLRRADGRPHSGGPNGAGRRRGYAKRLGHHRVTARWRWDGRYRWHGDLRRYRVRARDKHACQ